MNVGDIIPLVCQLADYNTGRYVRAFLYDQNNAPIGSPVNLTQVALGLYTNYSLTFPSGHEVVTVQYIVYLDSGYTEVSGGEGASNDVFQLTSGGGGSGSATDGLIGILGVTGPLIGILGD